MPPTIAAGQGTAPQRPPAAPESQRVALIVLFLLFYVFNSPSGNSDAGSPFPGHLDRIAAKAARQDEQLRILNTSSWGDFVPVYGNVTLLENEEGRNGTDVSDEGEAGSWLNLTGFRRSDGYKWELLERVREMARAQTERAQGMLDVDGAVVYGNVTGILTGVWVREGMGEGEKDALGRQLNLSEIMPDVNWAVGRWDRNITGQKGKLVLQISPEETDDMFYSGEPEVTANTPEIGDIPDSGELPEPGEKYSSEKEASEMDSSAPKADTTETSVVTREASDASKSEGLTTSRWKQFRDVSATLTVQDAQSTGDGWEMRVHGVHWPQNGVLIMTTTSEKFAGIFGLPHLTLNDESFATSKMLLNKTLWEELSRQKKAWGPAEYRWMQEERMPTPHCEYVVYVQTHPILGLSGNATELVAEIEDELRFPDGTPLPSQTPPLQMSTVIYSPDCGFVLKSKGPPDYTPAEGNHLEGLKQDVWFARIKNWSLVWAFLIFAQTYLLRAQMKDASTPSTISKISLYTFVLIVLADALIFASGLFLAISGSALFPAVTITGFAGLLSTGIGIRFVAEIFSIQEPERREQERFRAAAAAASQRPPTAPAYPPPPVPGTTAPGTISMPPIFPALPPLTPMPPTTTRSTRPASPPIIIPSDQDIDAEIAENTANGAAVLPLNNGPTPARRTNPRAEFATSYGQFVFLLFFILLLSMNATTWPVHFRTLYTNILAFLYLSFWVPQIYRNIVRNCRKALLWKFVIGQSVLRLCPFAYFYLKKDNVLFAETDKRMFAVLVWWVWVQCCGLLLQEVLGPRTGIPKALGVWTVEAWEWHPVLREGDVEGGGMFPIGLVQSPSSPIIPGISRSSTGGTVEGMSRRQSTVGDGDGRHASTREVDCAICMQVLQVPVVPAGEARDATGGVAGMLARRQYMVTPCRHVFHSKCLEGWMKYRLACPICREGLPPL